MVLEEEPLTSTLKTPTDSTITVRVIKSFEYRTERNLVLRDLDLTTTTVGDLLEIANKDIMSMGAFRPYRSIKYDTLKIYTKAHGAKTTNLIINVERDDWLLLDHSRTLQECGIENETEISLFNRELYDKYISNPIDRW
ncbi:hypothetical protein V1512DRAFT_276509 [Lipomyces arxii]|uniref:uncharacterized protein n=1 Tax=Lipomyces arxii TaxID=56418 RepID=UPI0034CDC7FF